MCLIIYSRGKGSKIPEQYIRTAYENNPDGFGMMWADDGHVNIVRGIYDIDQILSMMAAMQDIPHVVHFRFRTRGKIDESNCHPHRVLVKKIDGQDLFMMHNGTFMFLKTDQEESDSVKFAKHLRGALRVYGSDSLFDKVQLGRMAARVGSINKLVFLRGDGKIAIVNKNAGFEENGCWYSNSYSLKPGYREIQKNLLETKSKVAEKVNNISLFPKNQKKNKFGKKSGSNKFKTVKQTVNVGGSKRTIITSVPLDEED